MPIKAFYYVDKGNCQSETCQQKAQHFLKGIQANDQLSGGKRVYNLSDKDVSESLDYLASLNKAKINLDKKPVDENIEAFEQDSALESEAEEFCDEHFLPDGTPYETFSTEDDDEDLDFRFLPNGVVYRALRPGEEPGRQHFLPDGTPCESNDTKTKLHDIFNTPGAWRYKVVGDDNVIMGEILPNGTDIQLVKSFFPDEE
ncbi:hypothetical protein IJ670_01880 [bacterium]|nr:hypothetical protein [bacterium]